MEETKRPETAMVAIDPADVEGREELPAVKDPNASFSLFSILRNLIGKDLSRAGMPIEINEPLSMLQRCAEALDYRELLEMANRE